MRDSGFCLQKLFTTQAVWCGRQLNSLYHPKEQPGVVLVQQQEETIPVTDMAHIPASATNCN